MPDVIDLRPVAHAADHPVRDQIQNGFVGIRFLDLAQLIAERLEVFWVDHGGTLLSALVSTHLHLYLLYWFPK